MSEELLSKTKANTEYMTFNGDEFTAKIVYIYDGDTMHVVFNALGDYYRWNCRVMGVDTPELRTKNLKEKEMGYKVRDILKNYFLNQIVTIKCYKFMISMMHWNHCAISNTNSIIHPNIEMP